MTAGAEVVCGEVARKVEIEEKRGSGLNSIDVSVGGAVATVDCNVGGDDNGNGNVGGNGDSVSVIVSGSVDVEGSAVDPCDTGDVNFDEFLPKSDSAGEFDQIKKEELGLENEGIPVDPLVSETNGIVQESTTEGDAKVKAVKDDVNLENGSTVDPPMVLVVTNGHLDKISGEQEADVKSTEEVEGLTESTQNTIESSQVTVSELGAAVMLSDVTVCTADYGVMVNDGPESIIKLVDSSECQVADDESDCGTGIESVDVSNDDKKDTEVKDAHFETGIKNVDFPDEEKESEVNDAAVGDQPTLTFSDTIVNREVVIKFGSIGLHESSPSILNIEVEDMNGIQGDEISNSFVNAEEVNDAADVQDEEIEVLEYNFLVKLPRFEDENFRDQIRSAHALVEENTRIRHSIRIAIQETRDRMRAYSQEHEATKKKGTAARRVIKEKRQEIESVHAVINRWKNAMSVEDINSRIYGVEYLIQHETIQLKDEKEFIREIRQLKSLRDELAANMGTPVEIRHAIDTKDHNEERLKVLRKELEASKAKVSKIGEVLENIATKYQVLSLEERELQDRLRAAEDGRQQAHAHLHSLRKLSYEKNKNFRRFKEDLTTAKTYLSQGDKDALHRLCANQVETFMEQWNNNDEFRKEYVSRCNAIASRKQKLLDVAPLVLDDVAPVLPSNVIVKADTSSVSVPCEVKHVAVVIPIEQEKNVSVSPTKSGNDIGKSIEKVLVQKKQELKNKSVVKPTNFGSADVAKGIAEVADNTPTKEEIESARKAEELKKEEIAAKLKEQRRLEEKAKAIEALERKKRNAEKAQLRAEQRARKEAEQKEKEREKRLRKKEKKTVGGEIEEAPGSENEATNKEIETVNKKKAKKPPAHFFSKQLKPKPVPPPVLNRNRRRWQQAGHVALAALAVLVVFLLTNFGLFFGMKPPKVNMRF